MRLSDTEGGRKYLTWIKEQLEKGLYKILTGGTKCEHDYVLEDTYNESVFRKEYSAEGGGVSWNEYVGQQETDIYRCTKCLDRKLFKHGVRK